AEANAAPYGLTAGVFSRDDEELDRFLDEIEAGVVYVNRRAGATTGAWPGIQSFCGWKSSGLTGKGGLGPYYVQQFAGEQSPTTGSSRSLRPASIACSSPSRGRRRTRRRSSSPAQRRDAETSSPSPAAIRDAPSAPCPTRASTPTASRSASRPTPTSSRTRTRT